MAFRFAMLAAALAVAAPAAAQTAASAEADRTTVEADAIETVSDQTTAANAYAIGIGPSSSVFIWDTMLDGRFTPTEVRFVIGGKVCGTASRPWSMISSIAS